MNNHENTKEAGQTWRLAAALFLSLFLLWGSCFNTFGVFFMPLVKAFKQTHASVSLLSTILVLITGAVGPLAGWLLKKIGAKAVMGSGAAIATGAMIGASQARSFEAIVMWYVVLGLGLGASTWLTASVVITNWFRERPGTALGLITAGMELGGMLMTLLAAYVIRHYDWRSGYLVLAVPIPLLAIPAILRYVKLAPDEISLSVMRISEKEYSVSESARTGAFWFAASALFAYGLGVGGSFVHLVPYLIAAGYPEQSAAFALSTALGLMVVGKPLMGMLGDDFGARQVLSLGWIILGISTLLILAADHIQVMVIAIVFYGLTLATSIAVLPVVLKERFGSESLGVVMGWLVLFQTLGVAIGPILSGRLFDTTGNYTTAFSVSAVIIIVGAGLILGVAERDKTTALMPGSVERRH
jgi:MFS family permease